VTNQAVSRLLTINAQSGGQFTKFRLTSKRVGHNLELRLKQQAPGLETRETQADETAALGGIFSSVVSLRTHLLWVGHGGEALAPAGSCVPVFQPRHVPAHPTWKWDAGSLNTGAIMSHHLKAAADLNRVFDRIGPHGLDTDYAGRTLNTIYRGLSGIRAISQILTASSVAEDCDEQPLKPVLAGGLLDAVSALSSLMVSEIDSLADHAYGRAQSVEVHHG
jgi:hypothetical protein